MAPAEALRPAPKVNEILHPVEHLRLDDVGMAVFHIILRDRAVVFDALLRQIIHRVALSSLDSENDEGEVTTYEVAAPRSYYAADRYEEIKEQFLDLVKERNPKLLPLAELLTDELTKSEASRELGDAWSTVTSRTEKLKELVTEFLDNLISI